MRVEGLLARIGLGKFRSDESSLYEEGESPQYKARREESDCYRRSPTHKFVEPQQAESQRDSDAGNAKNPQHDSCSEKPPRLSRPTIANRHIQILLSRTAA